jgi:putative tryptophan/tyrosine transport system substrate-binding protein
VLAASGDKQLDCSLGVSTASVKRQLPKRDKELMSTGDGMKRRTINLALGLATAWPPLARGQQSGQPLPSTLRLGLVDTGAMTPAQDAFIQRLSELGFVSGRNLSIDHDVNWDDTLLDAAYADIVKRGTDILLAAGSENLLKSALRAAAGRVPVVFVAMDYDPLQSGYVASLARPPGNLTGVFVRQPELAIKRLEIARDALPRARRVALWWHGRVAREQYEASSAAAASFGFDLRPLEVGNVNYNVADAIKRTSEVGAEAIVLASSPAYYNRRAEIALAAREHRLPLIAFAREFVEVGALLSYGVNAQSVWRRAADYVARIARGTHPSDLPIEQPTTFELVINLRTASSLGLSLTPMVFGRADEVIE